MKDVRPLRPAYKVTVEFTICVLEGEALTADQIAAVVNTLPAGGNDWRDGDHTVKQVSSSRFPACEIGRVRLLSTVPAPPCVSVTNWPLGN